MSVFRPDLSTAPSASIPGKVFLSLFLSIFLGMGLIFLCLIGAGFWNSCQTLFWPGQTCVILQSEVLNNPSRDQDPPYIFKIKYRYDFNGQSLISDRFCDKTEGSSNWANLDTLARRYPVGSKAVCFVNPAHPAEAILQHKSLWFGASALLPLVFIFVGAGGIWFTWKPPSRKVRPLSDQAARPVSAWFRGAFFFLFLAGGIGAACAMGGGFWEMFHSGSWIKTPCTVESSRVSSHHGKSTTYSVDVLYLYSFQNNSYHSNRYSFMGGSSSGYAAKAAIVKNLPPGTITSCYVDPQNPTKAVLYRGWTGEMFLILVPLVFIAFGVIGIVSSLRTKPTEPTPSWNLSRKAKGRASAVEISPGKPLVLKPAASPFAKMVGFSMMALFWNGILSLFIYEVWESWHRGHPDWFFMVFLIPFLAVGLGLVGGIFYFLLSIGNPTAKLALNPSAVALGESLRLGWGFDGKTSRIQNLSLVLEAREEATYRRGTRSYTDKNVFFRQVLVQTSNPQQIAQGLSEIEVPAHLMHTFSSGNNKIVWMLTLHGSIPRWPDVKESFEIQVLPAGRIS